MEAKESRPQARCLLPKHDSGCTNAGRSRKRAALFLCLHAFRYYFFVIQKAGRGRPDASPDIGHFFFAASLRRTGPQGGLPPGQGETMKEMPQLKTERRRLDELQAAEYNPRKALTPDDPEYQKIKRSILEFGYVDPIIINADGTIIGGHQRCTVLKDLGYEEADVVVVDLDKNQEKALNVALNKITGEWDLPKLKEVLLDLDLNDYDFTLSGFDAKEVEDLTLALEKDTEAEDDDFDVDEALAETAEPITHRGDIWQLGRHRLMCGDSTDGSDVRTLMGTAEADLVITDPPYNVAYGDKVEDMSEAMGIEDSREQSQILNDNMSDEAFAEFLGDFYLQTAAAMREGAAIYVFHADSKGLVFRQKYKDAGLKLAQCLIWEKNTFVPGRQDYQWRHEPILYGWKEGAGHYFIHDRSQDTVILEDELDFESMKKSELVAYLEELRKAWADRTSVIYEKKPARNDIHPTMKPVSLIGRLMKNSSRQDWAVYDPFGGSGTTLIAAEQLDRRAYLMELDEVFCDVIVKRWENFTGQTAIMEE